jgi:hypothetical protein
MRARKRRQLGLSTDKHLDLIPRLLPAVREFILGARQAIDEQRCDRAIALYGNAAQFAGEIAAHSFSSHEHERFAKERAEVDELLTGVRRTIQNKCRWVPTKG